MSIPQGRIHHAKWLFLPPILSPHFLSLHPQPQRLHVSDIGADFTLERGSLDFLFRQCHGQLCGRKVQPHGQYAVA